MFRRQLQLVARWAMSCCACGGQNSHQTFGEPVHKRKCRREVECEHKYRRGTECKRSQIHYWDFIGNLFGKTIGQKSPCLEDNSSWLHDGPCHVACTMDKTATELLSGQRMNVNTDMKWSVTVNTGMEAEGAPNLCRATTRKTSVEERVACLVIVWLFRVAF